MHYLLAAIIFSRLNIECGLILQSVSYCVPKQCLITCVHHMRGGWGLGGGVVCTSRARSCIMAEPGGKLRPGVRLFPGGRVILLPTQIMEIMELAEMA